MSITSLGLLGGIAGTNLPQRATETVRADRDTAIQQRAAEATEHAETAAGIGQTEEDSQASERDADGRRLWEQPTHPDHKKPSSEPAEPALPLSKDPTGSTGNQLDLLG
jgi:hypothetical protein